MGNIKGYLSLTGQNARSVWRLAERHFSQLSVTILDKDRKLCVSFFYEIVDFFMLDKCSKPIFCPKDALKSEIAASW